MTDDEPKPWLLVLAFIAALAVIWFAIVHAAHAHWTGPSDPARKAWFDSLASGKGLCCSFADGRTVEDADWESTADPKFPYRVRVDGQWLKVPDDAVVTVPNKFGRTVVWPVGSGQAEWVRCFIPGAGA